MNHVLARGLVLVAFAYTAAATTRALASADSPKPRCAVLAQKADATCDAVADLLAIQLSAAGYQTVDRAHLAQTLGEQALAQAFAEGGTTARRQAGKLAGADLLVLLSSRTKADQEDGKPGEAGDRLIEWTVAAMPEGLRVASGGALWDENDPGPMLAGMMASVDRASAVRASTGLQPVCVPPFVCRDATFEFSGQQQGLARLAEELLMQMPGMLVVALDEVDALTTESELTGQIAAHKSPLFVSGEFTTARTEDGLRTSINVELRTAAETLGRRHLPDLDESTLTSALNAALGDLLEEHAGVAAAASARSETDALRQHALGLIRIGEWEDALPLLKTAVLLRPDDDELRMDLALTWEGLVSSTYKSSCTEMRRVEIMEHMLDEFEQIFRRRPVQREDIAALHNFLMHGRLRYAARNEPGTIARYVTFAKHFRRMTARIQSGGLETTDADTRARASWVQADFLISHLSEGYDTATIYREMLICLRGFVAAPGQEDLVVWLMAGALTRGKPEDEAAASFWSNCASDSSPRLRFLTALVRELLNDDVDAAARQFEARLLAGANELQIAPAVVKRIRDIGQVQLAQTKAEAARHSLNVPAVTPRFLPIESLPYEGIRDWITTGTDFELVISYSALYRVTSTHTFQRILDRSCGHTAWDSQYLWAAAGGNIILFDETGQIVAEQQAPGGKFLTAAGPGRAFVAIFDRNEQGGERYAYELWTLDRSSKLSLKREVLAAESDNPTYGLSTDFNHYRLDPNNDRGYFVPAQTTDGGSFFFDTCNPSIYDLRTRRFSGMDADWPRGTCCFQVGDAYYLFGSYWNKARRCRAIFTANGPCDEPQLLFDMGWVRYDRRDCQSIGRVSSALAWGDWMHVLAAPGEAAPYWLAMNLKTGQVRVLSVQAPGRGLWNMRLVASRYFGLVIVGQGTAQRVELPPESTWLSYKDAMQHLLVPEDEIDFDPWARWRAGPHTNERSGGSHSVPPP